MEPKTWSIEDLQGRVFWRGESRALLFCLEPILYNFEIAKYSPDEVTFDDYQNVEAALESLYVKYKKGRSAKTKKSAKTGKKKRRRPKKRATGARRRRSD